MNNRVFSSNKLKYQYNWPPQCADTNTHITTCIETQTQINIFLTRNSSSDNAHERNVVELGRLVHNASSNTGFEKKKWVEIPELAACTS